MHIAVFWKDDGKYYPAKVTARKTKHGKSEFSLEYDDGETETLDLSTEKFRFLDDDEEDDDDEPAVKRRRIDDDDDDEESEEEFEFEEDAAMEDAEDEKEAKQWVKGDDEVKEDDFIITDDEEEQPQPKKKKAKKLKVTRVAEPKTPAPRKLDSKFSKLTPPAKRSTATSPVAAAAAVTTTPGTPIPYMDGQVNPAGAHIHNHLKFLRHPKDSNGRTPDHPDYDARSIKIDWKELERHQTLSGGVTQWWKIKEQYFDTVLLFKTGKFYEMFHMDADIGVSVLDFCYMKGKVGHAGFPEVSYGTFSDRLVRAGYKVARVEQTETPAQLKERKKRTTGKKPSVVNREVCSILSLGTRTFCYLDDVNALESGASAVKPLLAIREVVTEDPQEEGPVCEYGVTLVDAARAVITIGEFADDMLRSRMNTLLTTFEPSEVSLVSICSLHLPFIRLTLCMLYRLLSKEEKLGLPRRSCRCSSRIRVQQEVL